MQKVVGSNPISRFARIAWRLRLDEGRRGQPPHHRLTIKG